MQVFWDSSSNQWENWVSISKKVCPNLWPTAVCVGVVKSRRVLQTIITWRQKAGCCCLLLWWFYSNHFCVVFSGGERAEFFRSQDIHQGHHTWATISIERFDMMSLKITSPLLVWGSEWYTALYSDSNSALCSPSHWFLGSREQEATHTQVPLFTGFFVSR